MKNGWMKQGLYEEILLPRRVVWILVYENNIFAWVWKGNKTNVVSFFKEIDIHICKAVFWANLLEIKADFKYIISIVS